MDKIQGKIKFIAPSLQDEHYSTAYILGNITWLMMHSKPVSYTHLRAHETRHDLVCRLLLEKKKKKKTKVALSLIHNRRKKQNQSA